jgi:hypothetical protein
MTIDLSTWLNSINYTKKNILDEDSSLVSDYKPFIINKCLSGSVDCLLFVNEMNMYNFLPKKMQYDFFINSLRQKKRFSLWISKNKIKDVEYVKKYYKYSDEKAYEALKILSKEQLQFIKQKFDTGGTK